MRVFSATVSIRFWLDAEAVLVLSWMDCAFSKLVATVLVLNDARITTRLGVISFIVCLFLAQLNHLLRRNLISIYAYVNVIGQNFNQLYGYYSI